jgi:hypothetical protein
MRQRLIGIGGTLAILVLLIGTSTAARAQQPATLTFQVTENRAPGGAGAGTITPLPNSQIRVDIRLTGMPPNTQHAAHIHTAPGARCDTNAPVTYPLSNVDVDAAGVGTSSTTLTLTADRPVGAGSAYVNVHQAVSPAGPGIICADVTASFTAGGAAPAPAAPAPAPAAPAPAPAAPPMAQPPAMLPRTGTGGLQVAEPAGWVVAGLTALVVLIGGVGLVTVARRQ